MSLMRLGALLLVSSTLAAAGLAAEARQHTQYQVRYVTKPLPQEIQLNNITIRDRQLRAQIASELQTGQLTHVQATSLITMLDSVQRTQNDYLSDGRLTQAESNALVTALGSVNDQLNSATNNPNTALNPSSMGFNLPNMGYPRGLYLRNNTQIGSSAPWWMY